MSKPIKITEDCYELIVKDVMEKLKASKNHNGVFNYSYNLTSLKNKDRAQLLFTPTAYIKIRDLVDHFSSEVGWHGTISKTGERQYLVDDIYVYPQYVTGSTVNTEQEEYDAWGQTLSDDIYNRMHFHGHSHVNFAVAPSGTDLEHRRGVISQLRDNDFYVFAIINKKNEWSAAIYDMSCNTLFETEDIDIGVTDVAEDTICFAKNNEVMLKTKTYTPVKSPATKSVTAATSKKEETKKETSKSKKTNTNKQVSMDDMDAYDYYDYLENRKKFWADLGYPY